MGLEVLCMDQGGQEGQGARGDLEDPEDLVGQEDQGGPGDHPWGLFAFSVSASPPAPSGSYRSSPPTDGNTRAEQKNVQLQITFH